MATWPSLARPPTRWMTRLAEHRPSPLAYDRTSPDKMVEGFLDSVANVKRLALAHSGSLSCSLLHASSTSVPPFFADRYSGHIRASNRRRFREMARGQVSRNGAAKGRKAAYQEGGIKFILSTCRTAFNWAARTLNAAAQSKPELFWTVKTGANRMLPRLPESASGLRASDWRPQGRFCFPERGLCLGQGEATLTYLDARVLSCPSRAPGCQVAGHRPRRRRAKAAASRWSPGAGHWGKFQRNESAVSSWP